MGYYFRSKTRAQDLTGSLGANTLINAQLNIASSSQIQLLTASTPLTPQIGVYDSNGNVLVLGISSNLTADITQSGAGGLDTGSEASDTRYYIWLIYKPSTNTLNLLLSTSSTSPTLPSGYTYKGLVGWVYNDADGDFSHCATIAEDLFQQLGDWIHYRDLFENTISDPGDGGTIDVSKSGICTVFFTGGVNETRTLPDPPEAGRAIMIVGHEGEVGSTCTITASNTIDADGNTQMTFDASGDAILLISVKWGSTLRWRVMGNTGVALS